MSAPIHPQNSASRSTQRSTSAWNVAHRHRATPTSSLAGSAEGLCLPRQSAGATIPASQMQTYKKLIEAIVRYLMKEGFTFIEAYEQVLAVGRLNPLTTANQLSMVNPIIDPEAFLEFKARNAITRLKYRYSKVIAALSA